MDNIKNTYNCLNFSIGNTAFQIFFTNDWYQISSWQAKSHTHRLCECHYFKSGSISLTIDNEVLEISDNTLLIFPRSVSHKIETLKTPLKKICFSIAITKSRGTVFNTYDIFNNIFSSEKTSLFKEKLFYLDLIMDLVESANYSDFLFKERLTHLFSLYFIELFNTYSSNNNTEFYNSDTESKNALKYKIELYIESELSYKSKFQHLSDYLCLSSRQTDRILKLIYNKSFSEIKNEKLIDQAIEMLEESNLSLKEIAENLGYNSYNGFYKMFKVQTGITPDEYRKNKSSK